MTNQPAGVPPSNTPGAIIDASTSPPELVMRMLSGVLAQLGNHMLHMQVAGDPPEQQEQQFNQILARIEGLASNINEAVEEELDAHNESNGVVLLAVLQVAAWFMTRYAQAAEANAGGDVDAQVEEWAGDVGAEGIDASPCPVDPAYVLRRKTREQ